MKGCQESWQNTTFTLSKCPQTVSPQLQGSVSSCAARASEGGKGLLWCFVSQTLGLYGHLLQCLWCENVAGLEDHHLNSVLALEVRVQPGLGKGEDYDNWSWWGLDWNLLIRITWEKKVAHLVCVVRGGKGDPQEIGVVLHSEKRRIIIIIMALLLRREELL